MSVEGTGTRIGGLPLRQLTLLFLYKSIAYINNRSRRSFGTRTGAHNYS